MPATLDSLMETASQKLADMHYAECESICAQALAQARDTESWVLYQRILLPLQEARRQKRQAALDGPIRLGVQARPAEIAELVPAGSDGCLVLTDACDALDASTIRSAAGESFELLYADNSVDAANWTITSTHNAVYTTQVAAPDRAWRDRWVDSQSDLHHDLAHWFMRASEALGDAGLASVSAPMGSLQRVRDLEHALEAAGDHELLHQALADAAKALHEAQR